MILNQLKNTHQANGCCGHCKREKKMFILKQTTEWRRTQQLVQKTNKYRSEKIK